MAYPTTIAAGTHVAGSIQASEDIAVEGSVQGTIDLSEMLIVAAGGVVRGDIQARVAHIDGIVVGTIRATERILLGPTARVQATITSPLFQMSDGAQYAGELNVGVDGDAPAPAANRSTPATTTSRATVATTASPARTATPAPKAPAVKSAPVTTAPIKHVAAAPSPAPVSSTVTVIEKVEEVEESAPEQAPEEASVPAVKEPSLEKKQQETVEANAETETVTFQELEDDYTVKELREELRRRDLPVTGSKSELIERLLEAESQ